MYRRGYRVRGLLDLSIALGILPQYDAARLSRARILFDLADQSSHGGVARLATRTLIRLTLYDADRIPDSPVQLSAERAYIKASCYLGAEEYKDAAVWAKIAVDKGVVWVLANAYLVLARAQQRLGQKHDYICSLRKGVMVQHALNNISRIALLNKMVVGGITDTSQAEREIAAVEGQIGRQYCPDEDRTLAPFLKPFEK
jgi:hypothetical protein